MKIPKELLIGCNLYSYLAPELAIARRQHLHNAIESGKPYYFVDQRGETTIEHHIFPIVDETGSVTRLAIFGMDVPSTDEWRNTWAFTGTSSPPRLTA